MNKRQAKKLRKRLGFKTWKRYRYERIFSINITTASYTQTVLSAKHLLDTNDQLYLDGLYHPPVLVFKDVDDKGHIRPKA